jgi:hypothetical protein
VKLGVFAIVILLSIGACSGAATSSGTTSSNPTSTPSGPVSQACAEEMLPFVNALQDLNSRLSVGLTFAAYSEKVGSARVAYDKLKPGQLDQDCLDRVGKPGEDALNEYVKAYTAWNDCIKKAGCETESIDSVLQGHWSTATLRINAIKKAMP